MLKDGGLKMESSGNSVLNNFIEVAMREKGFKALYGRAWAWVKCNIKLEVISLVSTSALYVIFGFVVIVVAVKGDLNFALYTIIPHADLKNLYFNLGFIAWGVLVPAVWILCVILASLKVFYCVQFESRIVGMCVMCVCAPVVLIVSAIPWYDKLPLILAMYLTEFVCIVTIVVLQGKFSGTEGEVLGKICIFWQCSVRFVLLVTLVVFFVCGFASGSAILGRSYKVFDKGRLGMGNYNYGVAVKEDGDGLVILESGGDSLFEVDRNLVEANECSSSSPLHYFRFANSESRPIECPSTAVYDRDKMKYREMPPVRGIKVLE